MSLFGSLLLSRRLRSKSRSDQRGIRTDVPISFRVNANRHDRRHDRGEGRNGLVNVDTRRHCLCSSIMTTCATAANFLENDRAQTSATVYDCTIFSCDPSYDLNYDRNELRVVSPARLFADGSAYAPVRAFGACPVDGVSPNRPNSNGNALFTGRLMRTIV